MSERSLDSVWFWMEVVKLAVPVPIPATIPSPTKRGMK